MGKPFRGKLSRRDQILQNNATHRFYAAASDKPEAQANLQKLLVAEPPKRNMVRRPVDGRPVVPLESAVNDDIFKEFNPRPDVKLWRNNRGLAVYGNKQVRYGVGPKGASDWIGYRKILITEEHLGMTIAQFVALEAKRPGERPDDDQQKFIDRVNADGGRAGWADSVDKAKDVLP